MTEHGNAEISIKCNEGINGVVLEKYHNQNYYMCWASTNNELNKQICRSLSGREEHNTTSDGDTYSYLGYSMNQ